jgi:hypothetical protein
VAYGTWTAGGYRDIRIVDVGTGELLELWHDRALDQQPAWSADGKALYFTSDRSGIANVYAWDLETGALSQVTNVLTGAYMPAPAPDGKTLVYVGYTPDGFDLFEIDLDPERFLAAEPPRNERGDYGPTPMGRYRVERYSALSTVLPRSYALSYGSGTFGPQLRVLTAGSDAIRRHALALDLTVHTRDGDVLGSFGYAYGRLPFGFEASVFRSAALREDYRFGEAARPVKEHQLGVTTGIGYGVPGAFDGQGVALSYTLAYWNHERPIDEAVNPNTPIPVEPPSGMIGIVRLAYVYSNLSASALAISPERGLRLDVAGDFADRAWGSEDTLTAFSGSLRGYLLMPWLRHHVLALALSGGASIGSYARYGAYSTGGFADTPAFDVYTSGVRLSAVVLRMGLAAWRG